MWNGLSGTLFILLSKLISIMAVITLHEFIKAVVSTLFGDTTPKKNNRLTLNPRSHVEPFGFLIFFLFGIGWGNPVPVSNRNYSNKKLNTVIVYAMPIVVHFALTYLLAEISVNNFYANIFIEMFVRCNKNMAWFNLIPIVPCAMGYVLPELLKPKARMTALSYMETLKFLLFFIIIFVNKGW